MKSDPSTASRPSQVSDRMTKIEQAINSLEIVINSVEDRFRMVVRSSGPELNQKDPKPEEALVELADALRSFNNRINLCEARLTSIINRAEL